MENLASSLSNKSIRGQVGSSGLGTWEAYDSSISLFRGLTRGWTWLWSFSALKAGLGTARAWLLLLKLAIAFYRGDAVMQ